MKKPQFKEPEKQVVNPGNRVVITFDSMPAAIAHLIDEVNDLKLMLQTNAKPLVEPESKYIYSIRGLAAFLNCSQVTAQKLKNEGKIKYRQIGRKIIFETSEVIKAMENHIPGNRSRNYQKS